MTDTQGKVARKYNARLLDFKKVFNSEQGKRVLYDLMSNHYIMRPTLQAKPDALELAFAEGQRSVVLRILTIIKQNPIDLTQLIEEAHAHATEDI